MPLADEAEKQSYENIYETGTFLSANAGKVESSKLIPPSTII
jgi:hypothetical protein